MLGLISHSRYCWVLLGNSVPIANFLTMRAASQPRNGGRGGNANDSGRRLRFAAAVAYAALVLAFVAVAEGRRWFQTAPCDEIARTPLKELSVASSVTIHGPLTDATLAPRPPSSPPPRRRPPRGAASGGRASSLQGTNPLSPVVGRGSTVASLNTPTTALRKVAQPSGGYQAFSMESWTESPVRNHPGGTEADATQERRELMASNAANSNDGRVPEKVAWRLGSKPTLPSELVSSTSFVNRSLGRLLEAAWDHCKGDDFACMIKHYETAGGVVSLGQHASGGATQGSPDATAATCGQSYGADLIEAFRSHRHVMCDAASGEQAGAERSSLSSAVQCLRFRTTPLNEMATSICSAGNSSIDFRLMPDGDFPWLNFQAGALTVRCDVREAEKLAGGAWSFMHCTKDWMELGFRNVRRSAFECQTMMDTPTLFLTRSGDYSPFAAAHDWINTVILMAATGLRPSRAAIVLMDRMTVGFYAPMWRLGFATRRDATDAASVQWFPDLRTDRRCYREAYFNIPARLSPLYNSDDCRGSSVLRFTADWLLHSVQALHVSSPPQRVVVTVILRKNYRTGHSIGRRISNSDALAGYLRRQAVSRPDAVVVQIIDFAFFDFDQQVRISRSTDVLVGMHGAGLIQMLFMPPSGGVFEFFCPERPSSNTRYQQMSMRLGGGILYESFSLEADDGVIPEAGMVAVWRLVQRAGRAKALTL